MSDVVWQSVNAVSPAAFIDVPRLCSPTQKVPASPIDEFLSYRRTVVKLAVPEFLAQSPIAGHLLLLGMASSLEMYFRTVLSRACRICPISRRHSAQTMLSLGALDYYGIEDAPLGVLEHVSFATDGEILKKTKQLTGLDLRDKELFETIRVYSRVCQMRHAAIHARGELGSGNTRELNLQLGPCTLEIDLRGFHEIVSVCDAMALVYNRVLFAELCKRLPGAIADGLPKSIALIAARRFIRLFWSKQGEDAVRASALYRQIRGSVSSALAASESVG